MKNGIEIRLNGNRIVQRSIGGYDVHVQRSDSGYTKSIHCPFNKLKDARTYADKGETNKIYNTSAIKDKIKQCSELIQEIENHAKEIFVPRLNKCKTMPELLKEWGNIIHEDLGLRSSDDIPGTFHIEIHFQMDRVRQLEIENAS